MGSFSLPFLTSNVFRNLPSFKGKTRVIRVLNRFFLFLGTKPIVECQFTDKNRFIVDLRSRTEAIPYYLGNYDPDSTRLIKSLVKRGWVILDVGANIGFLAVPLAYQVGSEGRVFCFEPMVNNFNRLKENLKINGLEERVLCSQIALSNKEGELKLGLYSDFSLGSSTGNAAPLTEGHPRPVKEVIVKKTTFDSWIQRQDLKRLDFIKVDIEGHEDDFLEGATGAIDKFRPFILGEFSEGHMLYKGIDVDDFFKKYFQNRKYLAFGITAAGLNPITSLKGRKNSEDILLVPEEKASLI